MRLFILSLFLFAQASSAQQKNWAVINDPDGSTNVRLQPSATSPAPYQVSQYQVFSCTKQPGDWWRFEIPASTAIPLPGGKGYIHKSRVRLFREMPDSALQTTICRILANYRASVVAHSRSFDKYLANGKRFSADEEAEHKKLVSRSENLHEYGYVPLLFYMPDYLQRTRDSVVLLEWCRVLAEDTGSASETPGYAMAEIFSQAPEWVARIIRPLPKRERSVVTGQILFGLMELKLPEAKRKAFEKRLRELENQ
ncbi:hypothetical protein ACQKLP_12520 [Chitinophaga sp. NPDC101104]|uniref:hypothetical protein n=1 Tax=Chitinophaga sp. NPDC101104 TaxID=3390561 RepID=UPI003D095129